MYRIPSGPYESDSALHMDGVPSGPMYVDVLLNKVHVTLLCDCVTAIAVPHSGAQNTEANVFLCFFLSRCRCSRQLSMAKRPGDPPLILEAICCGCVRSSSGLKRGSEMLMTQSKLQDFSAATVVVVLPYGLFTS